MQTQKWLERIFFSIILHDHTILKFYFHKMINNQNTVYSIKKNFIYKEGVFKKRIQLCIL